MSHKPDRATAERNTRTLRELVKRPENKVCSDCKRNDPRWASWNLGVFLCIRCSGIHRGMGTHISKVKSVDLDAWTPEQMDSIQKWGNKRANLYWEAHLKAGHIPPEHKMESFIRSKYESRRWAMEGPLPSDPSVLEGGSASPVPEPQAVPAPTGLSYEQHLQHQQRQPVAAPPVPTHTHVSSRSQGHQLLSSAYTQNARNQAPAPVAAPAPVQPAQQTPAPVPTSASQDLFSLDFHTPSPSATPSAQAQQQQPKKDVKHDIMSLFSATPAQAPATASFGAFSTPAVTNVWGGHPAPQNLAAAQPQATSMMGAASWGASSAWGAPQAPQQPFFATTNAWGAPAAAPAVPAAQSSFFNTSDVWGSSGSAAPAPAPSNDLFGGFASNSGAAPTTVPAKKDDVFGDIWGGFK
ncbi:ArfGap-domain-containing protein [Coprinellus micaceus]|uniref:ArfGap-domain-containing protein n=1 Tax=Coprinellus micaceus TaxID=71717 RepID=A0A4Y7SWQ0_COPMI|nr:ArfGap-domain-containing protein [Coprinellus micaceus]